MKLGEKFSLLVESSKIRIGQKKQQYGYIVNWRTVIVILFLVVVLGGLIALASYSVHIEAVGTRTCQDAGYSDATIYWNGDVYCSKIVNGTSVTVKFTDEGVIE
jgi:hypothetical protein